ncbi:two-component sensor histidine kinase [Brachybacterium sp. EF45031]|nr:two-component sensor histidine kinase [Brachybacterium sillae]
MQGVEDWHVAQMLLSAVLVTALPLRFGGWRWRWLLPLLIVVNAAAWSLVVLLAATFAYTSRCSRRSLSAAVTALALGIAAVMMGAGSGDEDVLGGVIATELVVLTVALGGMYVGTRRQLMHELRARAEAAESGRAAAEEQARRAERTRIAREMHDIVAHKISLVALQAGALEVNPTLEREQVVASAGLIRSTATEALTELRQVLGVLRGADESAPLVPQPTWSDVRSLVDASREAGVDVELFDFVEPPVPDTLARTAYRVVQEALTNIHKHARHTAARVALLGEAGGDLVLEISNVLPKGFTTDLPGARMGLSGIETRVTHAGGTITSGPTDDGRFEVKAVIPWPSPTP